MQNAQIFLPLDIYYQYLTKINYVEFTPREMDVISCILNQRAASISSFLSIGQRAVETHIRNIRQKAGGLGGRENIIDFIEKSGKLLLIKNEYYTSLQLRVLFEEKLRKIAKELNADTAECLLVYEKKDHPLSLIVSLKEHLKCLGFSVKTYPSEVASFFMQPDNSLPLKNMAHVLCLLPKNMSSSFLNQVQWDHPSQLVCLIPNELVSEGDYSNLKNISFVGLLEQENYYCSFFEILKKLFADIRLDGSISDFIEQCNFINMSSLKKNSEEAVKINNKVIIPISENLLAPNRRRFWKALICLSCFISISGALFLMGKYNQVDPPLAPSVHSDLLIPNDTVLLQRSELITKLDKKLEENKGIQAVALVGIGGAGKTTAARHYARQQKANIVWEINAETEGTLIGSFEKLAEALAKTKEDQKILRQLQAIKHTTERKEKIISFVKKHLKREKSWFLLFDNVENFSDIQNYFPQDINTWGKGKILLTTRNNNIYSSGYISKIVYIGELNEDSKLNLFMRILNQEKDQKLSQTKIEETKEFLKQIPSFPLDVSIAAHYLQTSNTSYKKYLENLRSNDGEFIIMQENLLKEGGEYTKTRYSIISVSLKQLIDTHKDFGDLLLFISLLDSQNIPRDLLDFYKNNSIVDNFIFHLKKYSLITTESSISSIGPTLSVHRSTQAMALTYLIKRMDLEKNYQSTNLISNIFINYMRDAHDERNFSKIKNLTRHCEVFLFHNGLFSEISDGILHGELGHLYHILSEHNKGAKLLKKSIEILNKNKNSFVVFRPFSYLGFLYWGLGEFKKSSILLEKSIKIYRKSNIIDHPGICQALTWAGILYSDQSDKQKAKNLLHEAVLIYENSHSKNYQGLASSLTHLGNLYRIMGEYKKAEFYLKKSLAISKKYLKNNNPTMGEALFNLGFLYANLGYFEKAKNLHESAFAIYNQYYPLNSRHIAWALRNLGTTYCNTGDFQKAEKLLNQSVAIFKKVLGENNIKTKWALFQLGVVHKTKGNLETAKAIFKDCLAAYKKQDDFHAIQVLIELAELSLMEKDLESAESFLNQSLEIYLKKQHPNFFWIFEDFGELYLKKALNPTNTSQQSKNFKSQAISNLKKALEIVEAFCPADSPHVIRIHGKIKKFAQE